MKKILLLFFVCLCFTTCGDDDNDSVEIQLSKTSCSLDDDNQSVVVDIINGAGEYVVESSKEEVAIAQLDLADNKIYIMANGIGNTIVTVTDKDHNKATIAVTVDNFTIYPPAVIAEGVYLKQGTTKVVNLREGINFSKIMIDSNIASIEYNVSKREVSIYGKKPGKTEASLINSTEVQHIYNIEVVDIIEIMVKDSHIIRPHPSEDAYYFHIYRGNGGYVIESSDESVASIEIIPYSGGASPAMANPATVKITPLKPNTTATLTITDAGNQVAKVEIETPWGW